MLTNMNKSHSHRGEIISRETKFQQETSKQEKKPLWCASVCFGSLFLSTVTEVDRSVCVTPVLPATGSTTDTISCCSTPDSTFIRPPDWCARAQFRLTSHGSTLIWRALRHRRCQSRRQLF